MINTIEALNLFATKFQEKFGKEATLSEDNTILVLNNCVMFFRVDEKSKEVKIECVPDIIKINENLDIYVEEDIEPQNDQLQKSLTKLKLVAKSRTHNLRETEVYKMAVNDCINVIEQIRMVNKSE